jgi:hypothetical protein
VDLSDPQFTAEFWGWAARLSSAAGIIGGIAGGAALLVAVVQLRHIERDQQRIANELTRRPRILVGFDEPYVISGEGSGPRPLGVIRPEWDVSKPYSLETGLAITIVNQGEKTARGMVCNFTFPTVVGRVEVRGGSASVSKDLDGDTRVICTPINLNPGVHHRWLFALEVTAVDAFTGMFHVSLEDAPTERTEFRVLVATQPPGPLPRMLTRQDVARLTGEAADQPSGG